MSRAIFRPFARLLVTLYRWAATFYGAAYIGLKTTWDAKKAASLPDYLADTWEFLAVWGWMIAAIMVATSGPAIWLSKKIQPEQVESILKTVLANYRNKAKPAKATENDFRVTLYKYRNVSCLQCIRCLWGGSSRNPWAGWLCPYVRPGLSRQSSSSRWHASLQKPGNAEGVAGKVFESEVPLVIQNLPGREDVDKTEKKFDQYIKETGTPKKMLSKRIAKASDFFPRSFYGSRVLVDNKAWGVLLIDSEHPDFPDLLGLNAETLDVMKVLNAVLSSRI